MKKRHTEEQIIATLREAEVGGAEVGTICRKHNISPHTFSRWSSKNGGMEVSDARKLRKSLLPDRLQWVEQNQTCVLVVGSLESSQARRRSAQVGSSEQTTRPKCSLSSQPIRSGRADCDSVLRFSTGQRRSRNEQPPSDRAVVKTAWTGRIQRSQLATEIASLGPSSSTSSKRPMSPADARSTVLL